MPTINFKEPTPAILKIANLPNGTFFKLNDARDLFCVKINSGVVEIGRICRFVPILDVRDEACAIVIPPENITITVS